MSGRDGAAPTESAREKRALADSTNDDTDKDSRDASQNGGRGGAKEKKKKRRKVNHACVYCRRSHMTCDLERPCTRCIKRNIGHLCHDEPRDADLKKGKAAAASSGGDDQTNEPVPTSGDSVGRASISSTMGPPTTMGFDSARQAASAAGFGSGGMMPGQGGALSLVQPGLQNTALGNGGSGNTNQLSGYSDAWMTAQNFGDMNNFNNSNFMVPEVHHEFSVLNDFLQTSLLDDNSGVIGATESGSGQQTAFNRSGQPNASLPTFETAERSNGANMQSEGSMMPPPNMGARAGPQPQKASEQQYYLEAADPTGNDNPELRMGRILEAKYKAGMLKPFNYINGYARLSKYLDGHIAPSSKQKILRTIQQFRPKFREKAQGLTDLQLVWVEMWFEKQLMEYDRVFASMAVPACCWRRTGEIFRGNKEFAELINVPVDQLRDGKIALHEILTEESTVRYWEEFGTIAFDPQHDTLLTACSLKNPNDDSTHPIVKSCFSFTIKRDHHKLPALIVGNFLPHDPPATQ